LERSRGWNGFGPPDVVQSHFQNKFEAGKRVDGSAYEQLVQAVIDYAIYILDLEGRIASWNAGAARIKGYLPEEILGEHFSRFYIPEERDAGMPQRALQIAKEDGRYSAEGWRIRKDGARFWARGHSADVAGWVLVGFAKITRDITEAVRHLPSR
jgi:PAS domain S-box-containing protein